MEPEARRKLIIAMARKQYEEEGTLEIDDDGVVKLSEGEDNGCYVCAWVWVDFAGTKLDKERAAKLTR
jgi:hypothetical protein